MIIKTSLLWRKHSGNNIAVFEGYYDMLEDWHDISNVYLDTVQTSHLIIATDQMTNLSLTFLKRTNEVSVLSDHGASIIRQDTISFNGVEQPVFKFPAKIFPETAWINAVRLTDQNEYHWEEIYYALIEGIKRGIQAGSEGNDRIDGLLPEEWAWKYVSELIG